MVIALYNADDPDFWERALNYHAEPKAANERRERSRCTEVLAFLDRGLLRRIATAEKTGPGQPAPKPGTRDSDYGALTDRVASGANRRVGDQGAFIGG